MDKFNRNYELQIQKQDLSTLVVRLPFTIEFDITRNTLTSANVCQIRVYNLKQENRNQIRFNVSDYGTFRSILLRAGYGENLATIFTGNISQAWSVREGNNMITQIECYDGGYAFNNGNVSMQFPASVTNKDVIRSMASTLPHTKVGAIGSFPGTLQRGNAYSGNTMNMLGELTGGAAFIDNGKLNALGTNEYISDAGGITLINAKSGLLGTPVLERTIVHFDMLFEPNLITGQSIFLDSVTEGNFNGKYKVTAVKHRGMISESVAGSVITTGEFFYSKLLTGVSQHGIG